MKDTGSMGTEADRPGSESFSAIYSVWEGQVVSPPRTSGKGKITELICWVLSSAWHLVDTQQLGVSSPTYRGNEVSVHLPDKWLQIVWEKQYLWGKKMVLKLRVHFWANRILHPEQQIIEILPSPFLYTSSQFSGRYCITIWATDFWSMPFWTVVLDMGLGSWIIGNKAPFTSRDKK